MNEMKEFFGEMVDEFDPEIWADEQEKLRLENDAAEDWMYGCWVLEWADLDELINSVIL